MAEKQPSATTTSELVEADELIALIKAIKFAYEDYGVKRVHDQIKTHGGKFEHVPLKRVKKYMQKLGMTNTQEEAKTTEDAPVPAAATSGKKKADLKQQAQASAKKGAIQLMTVGVSSKSERPQQQSETMEDTESKWLPVKLDEPASKVKQFPHQAVIRMTSSDEGDATGEKGEIYKIQVAMLPGGALSTVDPMLVYNKARNRKTFLHPDSPAYLPVQRKIEGRGFNGAVGGAKAYFWGRYRKEDDMVYINTEELAPVQKW
ncbi:hypothetical protein Poli38472_008598 [Pythium oligandrum]|uniref:Uncharacterized protein n=1 Tax=Pythium oligandrum TaxID=41045 RepID=A0A8K1FA71_PYTOL|nr:hypothetical protein Poli38472_008598 [Pythium oligandrum]|eukprot:TMW55950.1 hypothetical protein Poli38472_008598 [Pythium oligandrum]